MGARDGVREVPETVRLRRVLGTPARLRLYASSSAAASELALYHPMRLWGRAAHRMGLIAHRAGLAPRGRTFARQDLGLDEAEVGFQDLVLAEARRRHRVLTVVGDRHAGHRVLKTGPAISSLANEASVLGRLNGVSLDGIRLPKLIEERRAGERLTLVISWLESPRRRQSRIQGEEALRVSIELARAGVTHGDLAPWNIVPEAGSGVGLCDWEHARFDLIPGFDIAHYVVQSATLLGWWTPAQCARLLVADGGLGARYAQSTGIKMGRVVEGVVDYLDSPGDAAPSSETAVRLRRAVRDRIGPGASD